MKVNVSEMTIAQLKKLATDVEKELVKRDTKRIADAKKAAEKAAKQFGLTLADLGVTADAAPKARKAKKAAPGPKGVAKYANPENPAQTWTGKGRKPNWINAGLDAGKSLDDFAIK